MRRFERDGTARLATALDALRQRQWDGVTEATVLGVTQRLHREDVIGPFRDAIIRLLQEWAIAGSDFGRAQIEGQVFGVKQGPLEIDWTLANNAAAEWAIQYGRTLTGQLLKTTNERIQREIANFIQNQETLGELIERVSLGGIYSEERARTIAVTELTRAFAEGNRASWRESGIIEQREWRTNNDELVCPICAPLAGQVTGLDQPFPGGIDGPPAHPRCRCWIVPVVGEP